VKRKAQLQNLSGYLDNELTQGDRQRVELHMESCADCRQSYEEMAQVRADVGQLSFGEISHEEWSGIMNDLSVRTSRGAGWLLYIVGLLGLVGYGAYQFYRDDTVPALVKTFVAAILIGLLLLFISVLRQRIVSKRSDKYQDVQI
jgi:hypothetical protein